MSRSALALFFGLVFVAGSHAEPPAPQPLKDYVQKNKTRHAVASGMMANRIV